MIPLLFMAATAHASIDPACQATADAGTPAGYSDQGQQDFLLNFFAIATTFSPIHAPIPQAAGRGSLGLELSVIPPLSCKRRLVLSYTKTEDTNKAPLMPRPRLSFSMPKAGPFVIYGSLGYVPPITIFGTRNVIVSAEAGIGLPLESGLQFSLRYHATLMKTIAEIATPFAEGDTAYDDFYMGSTFGADLMGGYRIGHVVPYLAVGFTDVSTFFYIGDDGVVGNNLDPYAGLAASVGMQGHISTHFNLAGEFYTAPGAIYTGRLLANYVFGEKKKKSEG